MNLSNVNQAVEFVQTTPIGPLRTLVLKQLQTIIEKQKELDVPYNIAVVGNMGVGKSAFMNKILGFRILPSSSGKACSSTPIKIGFHDAPNFVVAIEFCSFDDFKIMLELLIDSCRPSEENGEIECQDSLMTLRNIYRLKGTGNHDMNTMLSDAEYWKASRRHYSKLLKRSEWGPLEKLFGTTRLETYERYDEVGKIIKLHGCNEDDSISFVVREISIKTNMCPWLGNNGFIIDLPGINDVNPVRAKMHDDYIKDSEYLFLMVDSNRVLSEKITEDLLKRHEQNQMDGRYQKMGFIITKCDQINLEEIDLMSEEQARELFCLKYQKKITNLLSLTKTPTVFATARNYPEGYVQIQHHIKALIDCVLKGRREHLRSQVQNILQVVKWCTNSSTVDKVVPEESILQTKQKTFEKKISSLLNLDYNDLFVAIANEKFINHKFLGKDSLFNTHYMSVRSTFNHKGVWRRNLNDEIRDTCFSSCSHEWDVFFNDYIQEWSKEFCDSVFEILQECFNDVALITPDTMATFKINVGKYLNMVHSEQKHINRCISSLIKERLRNSYCNSAGMRGTGSRDESIRAFYNSLPQNLKGLGNDVVNGSNGVVGVQGIILMFLKRFEDSVKLLGEEIVQGVINTEIDPTIARIMLDHLGLIFNESNNL